LNQLQLVRQSRVVTTYLEQFEFKAVKTLIFDLQF
jgi:hypothetical protein